MDLKKMKEEVDQIVASVEAMPTLGAALQVEDLSAKYEGLFTSKALKALKNEIKELDPQMEVGGTRCRAKTVFFSYCVRKEENQDDACKMLVATINDLVERDYVIGFLAPLAKIRLFSETLDIPHAIFIFPHLTKEGAEYLKSNKPASLTDEGGIGPYIDSLPT